MVKVAGYARYSTQKQDGGVTIETQEEEMRKVCQSKAWEYYKTFKDEGVSGAKPMDERPGLAELMDEAELKLFERVMVLDNSRLARDHKVFWDVIAKLREWGLVYTTAMMPDMDSSKPEFEMIGGTMQGMASYERRLVSFKTRIALNKLKEKGRWVTRPKVGFVINAGGFLEPNDVGKKVIELLGANRKLKAKALSVQMGMEYYEAWQTLKNCKVYMNVK